jgi:hypothetical protein
MVIILVDIDGYSINGYRWLFYCEYWWLLVVILLMVIDGYYIGGY